MQFNLEKCTKITLRKGPLVNFWKYYIRYKHGNYTSKAFEYLKINEANSINPTIDEKKRKRISEVEQEPF